MSARVDVLAQEIRSVDASHSMGSGRLAEALMPFIDREFVSRAAVAELIEAANASLQASPSGAQVSANLRLMDALDRIGDAA